nr:hypothetical protein CFP56_11549 [Quercus suber]
MTPEHRARYTEGRQTAHGAAGLIKLPVQSKTGTGRSNPPPPLRHPGSTGRSVATFRRMSTDDGVIQPSSTKAIELGLPFSSIKRGGDCTHDRCGQCSISMP